MVNAALVFDALPTETRILYIGMSAAGFALCFILSWVVLHTFAKFRALKQGVRADLCARVNSTLHTLIIIPGLVYGLANGEWSDSFEPESSVAFLQSFLCITVGYFLTDLVVIVLFQTPMWWVYVLHHLMAGTPYTIYLLVAPCPYGLFVLCMFLMVEITNLSLNVGATLQEFGKQDSKAYIVALYFTVIGWIPFRIVNPIFCMWTIHAKVFPSIPRSDWWCLIPSCVCAYFIVFFCVAAFFGVVGKELWLHWFPKKGTASSTKALDLNPKVPLTEEELELSLASPTRTLLYNTRGQLQDALTHDEPTATSATGTINNTSVSSSADGERQPLLGSNTSGSRRRKK